MAPSRSRIALLSVGLSLAGACGEAKAPPSGEAGTGGGAGTTAGAGGAVAGVSGAAGSTVTGGAGTGGSGGSSGAASGAGGSTAAGGAGTAGTAGGGGDMGTSGTAGSALGGGAGTAGAGGETGGAGGGGSPATGGAGAGAGASAGGAAGSGGMSGGAGSSGTACPAGPFPAPMVLSTTNVCEDFDLRYSWNEGPAWVPSQNAFFFTNFVAGSGSGGDIIKYTPGGSCERFMSDIGCNGLAPSNDGGLLAACQQTRSVVRIELETKQMTPLASTYMGMMLDTPNDLVQHSNGSIYFTNPINELDGRPVGVGAAAFRIDPNGMLSVIDQGNCNGVALSPDESKLYVIQLGMWELDAQGVPSNRESLFTSGDGIAVDCAGNVYANGNIFNPEGEEIGNWGNGTNLAFGGADGKTVLVVGRGTPVRELSVNVPGPP